MQKLLTFLFAFCASISFAFATTTPADVVIDSNGKIQIDAQNPRFITGCWASDENAVMFYRDASKNIYASEICNEPDASHHGLGLTDKARALNYYDFLNKTKSELTTKAPIVLGSISGYNYGWLKEFLALPDACSKFDILAFHPYHLGVAPDEINTSKNAYHTVTQWVNFYREILKAAGCEKPIWVTEFGFTQSDYDAEKAVTAAEQSDFAMKEMVMLLADDVKRVSYFDKNTFALDETAAIAWNSLVNKLVNSKLESFTMSGEAYCPRVDSCFYDASDYRTATGKSIFGLPAAANAIKKNRTYTFLRDDGKRVFVAWETGKVGIQILESQFSDVTADTPYAASILKIAQQGIINGYSDKTFKPAATINRAEFLTILVKATDAATSDLTGNNCFPDVKTEWFAPYVCYAKTHGWIAGYADGKFLPANSVNRAEALKMIANAFGYGISLGNTTDAWYLPYVNIALSKNVLLPTEARDYGVTQTRGFIAEMISRAMGL